MRWHLNLFALLILPSFTATSVYAAGGAEIQIDSVVASVDGKPITLFDLCNRLTPPRRLTAQEASQDQEARASLDEMILERVIQEEAEKKNVKASDDEVETYINEVAARNNMSRPDFENALLQQGRKINEYKEQIKLEIVKSKIAGNVLKQSASVSDDEVTNYIKENQEQVVPGTRLKLRQIFLKKDAHTSEEATALLTKARERIGNLDDFTQLVSELSEGDEAREGGLLGVISEKDLGPQIFDAVFSLEVGHTSDIVTTDTGYHVFFVEDRSVVSDAEGKDPSKDEALRTEVRKRLERSKMESKMATYFTSEVFKQHSVDKKI